MESNRVKLYDDFRRDADINKLLKEFDTKYPDYTTWDSKNFSDEEKTKNIWNLSLKDIISDADFNTFVKKFACDKEWTKSTEYCKAEEPSNQFDDILLRSYTPVSDGKGREYISVSSNEDRYSLYSDSTAVSTTTGERYTYTVSPDWIYIYKDGVKEDMIPMYETTYKRSRSIQQYIDSSGFNNWDNTVEVTKRVNKIKELLGRNCKSDVFYWFYENLRVASESYSELKAFLTNSQFKEALYSRKPKDSELGNYSEKDLGDTGLWVRGKYFYYIPNTSTASSQSYGSSDLTSAIDILLEDPKLSGRTTDNQYHALLDMYTSYFITNPRVNEICKNQNDEMQERLESAANGLTKNEEWRKLKQILVKGDSKNKFNTGRSSFCRSSMGIPIRFKTLFDLFSELPGKPRINKNMDDWRRQTGVLQEHNIMDTVRKNLILEKKNRDQKLLKETVEIENRFQYVIESVGLTNKSDVERIVEGVFYEMLYLENNGYNREIMVENIQSILDALGSLFGGTKNAVIATFKEKGIDYILSKLGLSKNSYMGDFLAVTFGNVDLKDIPRLFTDCDFLTKKIAEAAPEAYLKNIQDEKGFDNAFMDYIRNALYDVIRESDIVQKLEERISGIICPIISGLSTKFDDKLNSIKSSLI